MGPRLPRPDLDDASDMQADFDWPELILDVANQRLDGLAIARVALLDDKAVQGNTTLSQLIPCALAPFARPGDQHDAVAIVC